MSKVLTLSLNPSLDKTVSVERIVPGQELRAREVRTIAGGKAVNVMRTLRSLDVDAAILGIAGGAAGKRLEELIDAESLSQEWVWSDEETRTNLTIKDRATGRAMRILEPGARVGPKMLRELNRCFRKELCRINAVVFTGSLPPGISPIALTGMIRAARRANVLSALDASGAALAEGLMARPFVVKPNRLEAEEIGGFSLRSQAGWKKALQYFSERSNIVLISLGEEGLIATDSARMFLARGPVRHGLTVGCGDAALAGFLAGFLKGEKFEDCLRLAAACGAANVGARTPGHLSRRLISEIQSRIKVERLPYVHH